MTYTQEDDLASFKAATIFFSFKISFLFLSENANAHTALAAAVFSVSSPK